MSAQPSVIMPEVGSEIGRPLSHPDLEFVRELTIEYPPTFTLDECGSSSMFTSHPCVREGLFKTDLRPGGRYAVEFHRFQKPRLGIVHLMALASEQNHLFGVAHALALACLQHPDSIPDNDCITCLGKPEHLWRGDARWVMTPVFQREQERFNIFLSSGGDSCRPGSYVIYCRELGVWSF